MPLRRPGEPGLTGRHSRGVTPAFGVLLLLLLCLTGASPARKTAPRAPAAASRAPVGGVPDVPGVVGKQTQRHLNALYAFDPGLGTRHGVHAGDDRLGGFTKEQMTAEIARLKTLEAELAGMKTFGFTPAQRVEHERLLLPVRARRLEFETLRRWERDPGYYVEILADGIAGIMEDTGLSDAARLRAITGRLGQTSAVLGAALENVSTPSRPAVRRAIRVTEGFITYLTRELPEQLPATAGAVPPEVGGADAPAPVGATPSTSPTSPADVRESALRDLTSFRGWLKDDLLPGATGTYAAGPEAVTLHVLAAEACDASLARIEKLAVDEVTSLRTQIESTARALEGSKSPLEACRIYSIDHPAPARLLNETGRAWREIEHFLSSGAILAHDDTVALRMEPNPAYARHLGPARTRVAGPWEPRRQDPTLFLSFPEPEWDDLREEDHLRSFSRYALPLLLMRTAEPGRVSAELRARRTEEGRINRALAPPSALDGWCAHAEAAMLEAGYGDKDGRLRLFHLRSALLDAALCVATLRIHTAGMTAEQAADYLQKDALQDRETAEREALRAACDLSAMSAFLGRAQIMKLVVDARRARGTAFDLRAFQEELLALGGLPPRLARQRLLPGDKSPTL